MSWFSLFGCWIMLILRNEPWAAVGKGLWSKLFDVQSLKSTFRWNDKPNYCQREIRNQELLWCDFYNYEKEDVQSWGMVENVSLHCASSIHIESQNWISDYYEGRILVLTIRRETTGKFTFLVDYLLSADIGDFARTKSLFLIIVVYKSLL